MPRRTSEPLQTRVLRMPRPLIEDLQTIADREEMTFAELHRFVMRQYVTDYESANGKLAASQADA